ncbi:Transferase [Macleaya cordata]|uniref:Transferase n=1 Tax=Macleaya cordata TaxID=56857 RepID=A0A200QL91_MACCD|nr:Transferase [Macleaya cordata]
MNQATAVRQISKCTIKPHHSLDESHHQQVCYLTPWDIAMLSAHYIQKGLLFSKPQPSAEDPNPTITFIDQLKHSLSLTLTHFFPLSGRLVTKKQDDPPSYSVYLDCSSHSLGAEFIHAAADVNMVDIISPVDVPPIVKSFFVLDGAVNHDGHTMPLLVIQVTELLDGIFVGCCFNHVVGDGTSYWHFFNSWAEICRTIRTSNGEIQNISRPPIIKRWFLGDQEDPTINLPFSHHDEFIERYRSPPLRERIFHFTPESMAKLKAKANAECNTGNKISSFQALSALMWRSITRARCLPADQKTGCKLAINNRSRLDPLVSENYFGNCIQTVGGTTTAGELLSHGLGWAALMLHEAVIGHTNEKVRGWLEAWMKNPYIYALGPFFDPFSVMMGSSPRFDMFGCEFGLGRAVAARSGYANKFDGKVSSYPGPGGIGSVNLEVCLRPDFMSALESDEEFMSAVSPHEVHILALFD